MQCRWPTDHSFNGRISQYREVALPAKEVSLHSQIPLGFDLAGKGLFLKLFCLAQILSLNQVLKFISAC